MFGRVWNTPTFSETLGAVEVPVYYPFFSFFTAASTYKKNSPDMDTKVTMLYVLGSYMTQLAHFRSWFNFATPAEKAAAKEFMVHAAFVITGLIASSLVLGNMSDDDDKKKKKKKPSKFSRKKEENDRWVAFLNYLLVSTTSELSETVPIYGWYGFASRNLRKPAASFEMLYHLFAGAYYSVWVRLTQEEKDIIYQRGENKGQAKDIVHYKKALPVIRQIQKLNSLQDQTAFYRMINPFL
jgi:hypothetical protein